MKKQVYKVDENGIYIEPIIVGEKEDIPYNYIDEKPPNGLYRPKWTGTEWIEDMTQEEIDKMKSRPNPPTQEERIQALEAALLDLLELL